MQSNDNLYDLGETTKLAAYIVTRALHCVLIVTKISCHVVWIKNQSTSIGTNRNVLHFYCMIFKSRTCSVSIKLFGNWLEGNLVV